MIVVDASVLVPVLADDGPDGQQARLRLAGERLCAPELIDIEVLSAFRRLCATRTLDPERAVQAISDLANLRLERISHRLLHTRCWEMRHTVTMYDAAYVAVAEALDATLVTADRRLTSAPGARCRFELIA